MGRTVRRLGRRLAWDILVNVLLSVLGAGTCAALDLARRLAGGA